MTREPSNLYVIECEDKFNIRDSLEAMIRDLFDEYRKCPEAFDIETRLKIIQYVSMYETRDIKIRAANQKDNPHIGSAVRRYAEAFKSPVLRGRTSARAKPDDVTDDDADSGAID
jgi:hypothetical protein